MQAEDGVNRNVIARPKTIFDEPDWWFAPTKEYCQGGRNTHPTFSSWPDGRLTYNCGRCDMLVTIIKKGKDVRFL